MFSTRFFINSTRSTGNSVQHLQGMSSTWCSLAKQWHCCPMMQKPDPGQLKHRLPQAAIKYAFLPWWVENVQKSIQEQGRRKEKNNQYGQKWEHCNQNQCNVVGQRPTSPLGGSGGLLPQEILGILSILRCFLMHRTTKYYKNGLLFTISSFFSVNEHSVTQ